MQFYEYTDTYAQDSLESTPPHSWSVPATPPEAGTTQKSFSTSIPSAGSPVAGKNKSSKSFRKIFSPGRVVSWLAFAVPHRTLDHTARHPGVNRRFEGVLVWALLGLATMFGLEFTACQILESNDVVSTMNWMIVGVDVLIILGIFPLEINLSRKIALKWLAERNEEAGLLDKNPAVSVGMARAFAWFGRMVIVICTVAKLLYLDNTVGLVSLGFTSFYLVAIYALTTLINITLTGRAFYLLAYFGIFNLQQLLHDSGLTKRYEVDVDNPVKICFDQSEGVSAISPARVPHNIRNHDNDSACLELYGRLTAEQLDSLIEAQTTDAAANAVALAGVKYQLSKSN